MVETVAMAKRVSRVSRIIEKPKPGMTSSRLAVVGRYILTPRIFHHLRTMPPGAGGEIQLTDGIARLSGRKGARLRIRGTPVRLRKQARISRGDSGAGREAPGCRPRL